MASNALFKDISLEAFQDQVMLATLVGFIPRKTLFVDSNNGSNSYDGLTRAAPRATLASALSNADPGDLIVLLQGHAETLSTSGVTWSQSGVTVIGFGNGHYAPALTCGAADVVGITMSGSNNVLTGVRIIGSASQTSAASVALSITGTDNDVSKIEFSHGAGPLGCILMTAAHRTKLRYIRFVGTAAGPDFCIKTIGTAAPSYDCIIEHVTAQYSQSSGLDSCAIVCHNTTGTPGWIVNDVVGTYMDIGVLDINGSMGATTVDSLAMNVYASCIVGSSAAAAFDMGGMGLYNSFWTDAIAAAPLWCGVSARLGASLSNAVSLGMYPAGAGPS